jgi:hypothetical protein
VMGAHRNALIPSLFSLVLLIGLFTTLGCSDKEPAERIIHLKPTKDASSPTGVYIPIDLEDCFLELEKMLPPDFIERIKKKKESEMINYHLTLGVWIRNNWGLWKGSRLKDFFKKHDVRHPDDMSGIILTSFWRHLNGQPIDFEEQSGMYREYWDTIEKMMKALEGREPAESDGTWCYHLGTVLYSSVG